LRKSYEFWWSIAIWNMVINYQPIWFFNTSINEHHRWSCTRHQIGSWVQKRFLAQPVHSYRIPVLSLQHDILPSRHHFSAVKASFFSRPLVLEGMRTMACTLQHQSMLKRSSTRAATGAHLVKTIKMRLAHDQNRTNVTGVARLGPDTNTTTP